MKGASRARQLLEAVECYRRRGWTPVPVRGKKPCLRGWATGKMDPRLARREWMRPGRGVGLVLGESSDGLVDIDIDADAGLDIAPALLPTTALVHGRAGRPWSHWWYRSPGTKTAAFRGPRELGMIVELRAGNAQTCVPPSLHPSGQLIRWESWGTPSPVEASSLRLAVGRLAAATYLRWRGWPLAMAVHFARAPVERTLTRLEEDPTCPALRAWLNPRSGRARRTVPAVKSPRTSMSSYTQAILSRIDVVGAGRLLGLDLRNHRQQTCPFHEDRHASFQVSGQLWRCHAGCGAGTAIHLAARALGVEYREARNWLAVRLGIDWREFRNL